MRSRRNERIRRIALALAIVALIAVTLALVPRDADGQPPASVPPSIVDVSTP